MRIDPTTAYVVHVDGDVASVVDADKRVVVFRGSVAAASRERVRLQEADPVRQRMARELNSSGGIPEEWCGW